MQLLRHRPSVYAPWIFISYRSIRFGERRFCRRLLWPIVVSLFESKDGVIFKFRSGTPEAPNDFALDSKGVAHCRLGQRLGIDKPIPITLTKVGRKAFLLRHSAPNAYKQTFPAGCLVRCRQVEYRVIAWDRAWMIVQPVGIDRAFWARPCRYTVCVDKRLDLKNFPVRPFVAKDWREAARDRLNMIAIGLDDWSSRTWR